ncbi:MAG TPA: M48 family peptidase, partial [Opitutaceae bacterium]
MKRFLLPTCVATLLALAGCYTNPVTGRQSIVVISPNEEITLGAQSFQDIRSKEKVSTDAAANARIQRIGQRIAAAVGDALPGAKWEFVVFDS